MMVALLMGWMALGFGARMVGVVLGGIGFGLFLDEVGKFVTKDNDYFYGPAAEIMYILVVVILVGARIVRDIRPLGARECLASAGAIAAEGVARGLAAVAAARSGCGWSTRPGQAGPMPRWPTSGRYCSRPDHARIGSTLQRLVTRLVPGFSAARGGCRWWAG